MLADEMGDFLGTRTLARGPRPRSTALGPWAGARAAGAGASRPATSPSVGARHRSCSRPGATCSTRAACRTASRSSPAPRPAPVARLSAADRRARSASSTATRVTVSAPATAPVTVPVLVDRRWPTTSSGCRPTPRAATCGPPSRGAPGAARLRHEGGAGMSTLLALPAGRSRSRRRAPTTRRPTSATPRWWLSPGQGAADLRLPAGLDAARHLVRAARHRPDAAASRPQPQRPVRPAADPRRRHEVDAQGGHAPQGRADKFVFTLAPLITATMAFVSFAIIPLGGRRVDVRPHARRCSSPTSRSPCCSCSPSPASASTASSSPAGPPARPTRCSVACARPRR